MFQIRNKRIMMFLLFFGLCFSNLAVLEVVKAEKVGSGARIIEYGVPEQARFHMGGAVGTSVSLTAEPTGKKELSDVTFTSSNPDVCSVSKEEDYWIIKRIKEGTSIIRMECKVDGNSVVRTLLMSNLVPQGSIDDPVYGIVKKGTKVYYGCSEVEGITSKDTELKTVLEEETPVYVTYQCDDFYRVDLDDSFFGDSGEYWGYVKKSQVIIPLSYIDIPEELTYFEGESGSLNAKVQPENASDKRLNYRSSNTNVVMVDEQGNFKAVGVGSAVITVTSAQDEDCFAKCRMIVKPFIPVTGITLTPNQLDIEDGQVGDLSVKVLPKDASRPDYMIEADDDSILKIYHDGHYEAKRPGTTTITATTKEGNFKASCKVHVRAVPVKGVQIQPNMSIDIDEVRQPVWSMEPRNATNREVTWTSSDPQVATVDYLGRVTGISLGNATIRIKTREGGYVAACNVKVEQYVNEIDIINKPVVLTLGKSKKLQAKLMPQNPSKKKLLWKTSASSVVKVKQNGKIVANGIGSAKITVYDRYTGAYDYCIIHVKANLKKPELNGKKKNKKYKISWKKVKRATNYVLYHYSSKKKKFIKLKVFDKGKTSYVIKKPVKGTKYKLRALYKPSNEYSKYSNEIKIR